MARRTRAKSIAHLPACEMPYAKSFPSGLRTPCACYQLPCIHCDTLFYTFHSHHYVLVHEIDEPPKASVFQSERSGPPSYPYAHPALGKLKSTPCRLTAHHSAHFHPLNSAHSPKIVHQEYFLNQQTYHVSRVPPYHTGGCRRKGVAEG